jgi:hypothetical protein
MANLIIINNKNESVNLNEVEIHPEEAIEKIIFETKNILSDVYLLKRQLSTYTKEDRIDLVGLDNENNILIIEIKDEMVDENVIPQVMRYAFWVETHPDAIKSIWLEQKNKPEDFSFDWEKDFNIKIVIIGPSFKLSVQKLINKINYEVDLIEFKKFTDNEKSYIFLNNLPVIDEKPARPISTSREYTLEFYKKTRNSKSAEEFWKLAEKLEKYVKNKSWNLVRSNNKTYISFKYGFPIVFGISFIGSKSFCLFFKVPKEIAEKIKIEGSEPFRYEDEWKQVLYKVENSNIDLTKFNNLFEEAYRYISGK